MFVARGKNLCNSDWNILVMLLHKIHLQHLYGTYASLFSATLSFRQLQIYEIYSTCK